MKFFRIFILIPFLAVFSAATEEQQGNIGQFYRNFKAKLQSEADQMDKKFFKKIFPKENISKLFETVLEEEHALVPQLIISNKVRKLSNFPGEEFIELDKKVALIQKLSREKASYFKTGSESPKEVWQTLISLNEAFRSFSEDQQLEILMFWRELVRTKVQDHVAYLAGIKPWYKFTFTSLTSYDSNVNLVPDETNLPPELSGRDDGQQLFLASFGWKPLANNKKFSQNWDFINDFKVAKVSQFAHKENELMMVDIEPKLTRKNLTGFFKSASLGYRYQNFYFNGDIEESRDNREIQSYFTGHRLSLSLNTKDFERKIGFIDKQRSTFNFSWESREFTDELLQGQNAQEFKAEGKHSFIYGDNFSINLELELADYTTEDVRSQSFYYIRPRLALKQNYSLFNWKHKFNFSERITYRYRKWNDFVGNDYFIEDLTTFDLTASTKIYDSLMVLTRISQIFRKGTFQSGLESDADQFKAMFGLTWIQ